MLSADPVGDFVDFLATIDPKEVCIASSSHLLFRSTPPPSCFF